MNEEKAAVKEKEQVAEMSEEKVVAKEPKQKLRVFRASKPVVTRNKKYVTLMTEDLVVGSTKIKGKCIRIGRNNAYQYVLSPGAIEYEKQLEVLRGFVKKGELVEVDAKTLGVPFVSEAEKRLAVIEKERRELKAELGMAE